jgi:hypothetical protein
VSVASEYTSFDWDNLLLDHETWPAYFEEVFEHSSEAARCMTRVLFYIWEAVQSGPEDVAKAINTLKDGIEYAFRYTEDYRRALQLYLLEMEGNLKPMDEPRQLLTHAVERGILATKQIEKKERAKSKAKNAEKQKDAKPKPKNADKQKRAEAKPRSRRKKGQARKKGRAKTGTRI